ncbi:hypothetical protein BU24DRAFT_192375 [Aaosphaeria arxii CBS 175.79]|uniref:Uncharacterized protein n=1 Tax=Aaosphaeria arxii CBS 175.79 TaxID=1450172 RepID=A0A6A5XSB2_9PLEO|nr:uncharacterized protein BU24DRAFT_192375 [Aaosphaeria arxii CBS 175.79]KAF2016062.1 hypothetical protein BU24DRAFT_192375 [Aaosphaeria arxii CBS 175.79]
MRPSTAVVGALLVLAPAISAQALTNLPNLSSVGQPQGPTETGEETPQETKSEDNKSSSASASASATGGAKTTEPPKSSTSLQNAAVTLAPSSSSAPSKASNDGPTSIFHLSDVPTIAGVGIPQMVVPFTAGAPYMQKSNLPDGTVFICVGAALGFLGACVLAWRGLVAWSLHRSVKRAATAQNMADLKAMSAVPGGKKRGMYNVVGASSTMSLDHLSAAPTGTSRPPKPFASPNAGTPPRSQSSLFFSPTAGGAAGVRDSVNRSSTYLPAGYYPSGNAQAASGAPMTHIGGHGGAHLSTHSLATPGNRFSSRSGISPPGSPSLPPSRGYDRAPPSRDGVSVYQRNSVATLNQQNNRGNIYAGEQGSMSQLSLNVPGGTTTAGGRAPSAYLEDLFESHGNGPQQRQ